MVEEAVALVTKAVAEEVDSDLGENLDTSKAPELDSVTKVREATSETRTEETRRRRVPN